MLKDNLRNMIRQTPSIKRRHGKQASIEMDNDDSLMVRLAKKYKADKWQCHSYIPIYEELFSDIREEPLTILEIGIWKGHSLFMFEEYFPNSEIHGVDIDPNCAKIGFKRAKVLIADQMDINVLHQQYFNRKFDIVIEDGKHEYTPQILSAAIFYPLMKDNSIYIIEDIKHRLMNFDVLRGTGINLRSYKGRIDDQLLLIPRGDAFTEKVKRIETVINEGI
ncbi:MAG: class I SAM-dependent methyltransferase [Synergistaceae bacterium]